MQNHTVICFISKFKLHQAAGCSWSLNLGVFFVCNKDCRLRCANSVVCGPFWGLLEILSRKESRELVPCVGAALSTADCRMLWPAFGDQPAARPCHLPGRQWLPHLLLLGFILQTEPEEPGTWAKNNPLEGSQAAPRALELVLVSGRTLGWAVAAGHAGTSPAGAWEGGRGKEGGDCSVFEPCPNLYTQIQKAGSVSRACSSCLPQIWLPASCQSMVAPQQKCLSPSLHLPGWDHCIQQLECAAFSSIPGIRAGSSELGQKPFPSPSRVLAALRHHPFTSSGFFPLGVFLKIVFTVLTPLRDCAGK